MPETLIADIDLSDPVEAINALVGPHFPLESILKTNVSSWNLQFLICVFRRGFRPTDEELHALEEEFDCWLDQAKTKDDLDEHVQYNLQRYVQTSFEHHWRSPRIMAYIRLLRRSEASASHFACPYLPLDTLRQRSESLEGIRRAQLNDLDALVRCCVCQEALKLPWVTSCGHLICSDCRTRSEEVRHVQLRPTRENPFPFVQDCCPLCRAQIFLSSSGPQRHVTELVEAIKSTIRFARETNSAPSAVRVVKTETMLEVEADNQRYRDKVSQLRREVRTLEASLRAVSEKEAHAVECHDRAKEIISSMWRQESKLRKKNKVQKEELSERDEEWRKRPRGEQNDLTNEGDVDSRPVIERLCDAIRSLLRPICPLPLRARRARSIA